MSTITKRNRRVGYMLAGLVASMVGLAYASVPLYQLFCQVTGYAGTPKIGVEVAAATGPAAERVMTVMLDANVNPSLNWSFKPDASQVHIGLGEEALAVYRARNLSDTAITGTSTFNVIPFKAAQYVSKIDCFCFTEQRLEAGEEVPMLVSFYIDPEIMSDPSTKDLEHLVLSYTFFPSREAADNVQDGSDDNG